MSALVQYTRAVNDALESETDALNRPHYLGYFAIAARVFMYAQLGDSRKELERVHRLAELAHAQKLPGPVAVGTRVAWQTFSPILGAYIQGL